MALSHELPLDVISARPLRDGPPQAVSTSLIKTQRHLTLMRVDDKLAGVPQAPVEPGAGAGGDPGSPELFLDSEGADPARG